MPMPNGDTRGSRLWIYGRELRMRGRLASILRRIQRALARDLAGMTGLEAEGWKTLSIDRHNRILELATELNKARDEVEALRKDKDRLDALESNFWDVRYTSSPNGDAGDSSTSVEIVGSWMDEPRERVIGENYHENLRAAIDQAMLAPAYPPTRPEYEYDEIPDFTPGNGNKARRRAEALGLDYDAAMGDGSSALEPPPKCRQRLAANGKPYPRSSCEACGQFSPKWRECDALLAAMSKEFGK